jgi:hypothetical protein
MLDASSHEYYKKKKVTLSFCHHCQLQLFFYFQIFQLIPFFHCFSEFLALSTLTSSHLSLFFLLVHLLLLLFTQLSFLGLFCNTSRGVTVSSQHGLKQETDTEPNSTGLENSAQFHFLLHLYLRLLFIIYYRKICFPILQTFTYIGINKHAYTQ